MEYPEKVRNGQAMPAIIEGAVDNGFRVPPSDGNAVTVKAGCPPVEIGYGMRMRHGGRMWPSRKSTGICIGLSSDAYGGDRGIVGAGTEPAWRIGNEMADTAKSFERHVYVVEETGKHGDSRHRVRYFRSVGDASRHVFGEPGRDIDSEYGTVRHQCPNPDIYHEYTYDGEDNGRIEFIGRRFRRGNGEFGKGREWTIGYHVSRKGRGWRSE